MFVFTLVQSRTHVDTVQSVLEDLTNSRHIYWSHTMKVLGSHVTFVSSSSLHVIIWRNIHFDVMKMWSRMFAVNVQSVSVQQLNWDFIIWFTQTSDSFDVVSEVNISCTNLIVSGILSRVHRNWYLIYWQDQLCLSVETGLLMLVALRWCIQAWKIVTIMWMLMIEAASLSSVLLLDSFFVVLYISE